MELLTRDNLLLRQRSMPVEHIDANIRKLVAYLEQEIDHWYYNLEPAGFAAPQFGELVRIITFRRDKLTVVTLINPTIIQEKGEQVSRETCFSIPGHTFLVKRPAIVKCRGLTLDGKQVTIKGHGFLARVLKHEVDHLDGIMIDKICVKEVY